MKDLKLFIEEYKKYLGRFILQGGQDEVLFEAYQNLLRLLDESSAQAANLLDIHNQALKDVLNIRNDNDAVQWIYIERATEFLAQILIATDALLLSFKESVERDPLTGLYNRLAIERTLARLWKDAQAARSPLVVAMVDIDDFKRVNDSFGHLMGDRLLKEFSSLVRGSLRSEDLVLRYGGDEFLVVLPATDRRGAEKPLERIRKRVEEEGFAGSDVRVTVSVGASVYPDDRPLKMEELIAFADAALYEAKSRGRNRVVFYDELNSA